MKNPLNNVSVQARLSGIALIAVLFAAVPVQKLWKSKHELQLYTAGEQAGVPPLAATVDVLTVLQAARQEAIAGKRAGADKAVTDAFAKLEADSFVAQSDELRKQLATLREHHGTVATATYTPQEAYSAYTSLTQELQIMMTEVAGESGITLDPEAVSYYLYDIGSVKVPDVLELADRMRAQATLQGTTGSQAGNWHLEELQSRFEFIVDQLESSAIIAAREQANLGDTEMEGQIKDGLAQLREQYLAVKTGITELRAGRVTPAAVEPAFKSLSQSAASYNRLMVKLLGGELEQRQQRITSELKELAVDMLVLLALLIGSVWVIARSILQPLAIALQRSRRIAAQDLSADNIHIDGRNETIQLLNELETMRSNLLEAISRERVLALANERVREALDNASTCVMIADGDGVIIFANRAVQQMLREAEADLRRDLPQFSAADIVGRNFDVFHKNPAHQRNLLAQLKTTYSTQIRVGGRTFRLTANPIVDEQGNRIGTVIEWLDRTSEVAAERDVEELVRAAAAGDFSRRMDVSRQTGFFRQLGDLINSLMETSAAGMQDVARMLGSLANGDLTPRITADYQGMFGQLKNDSNSTAEQLGNVVQRIRVASDAISSASHEIAAGNSDLSRRTEQQAASLEETASSMEELTSTVKQNADNARQANELARGASQIAVRGGEVVAEVVSTMNEINTSSRRIVDIISVIDGIAFQTNILALNAAVEAARAGEQGRGFAVVAGEVRNLAQRSGAAAREIKSLIQDSVSKVDNGSTLVGQAGATMKEIVDAVRRVTDIMSEIAAASAEQGNGIELVNHAISQMDSVTQQNAALVEQAAAAAASLEEQAQTLSQLVDVFRTGQALPNATKQQPPRRALEAPDEWSEF